MKRKMIYHLATILDETGLNVLKSDEGIRKIWRLIINLLHCLGAVISLFLFSVFNYEDFSKFIIPIPYIATIIIILGGIVIIFYYRKIFAEILYQMDDNIYTYPDEDTIDIEYKWYLKEDNIVTVMSVLLYLDYFALFTMPVPSILSFIFYHKTTIYLYPCWTPWKRVDPRLQLFTLITQISQALGGFWLNHVLMSSIFMIVLEFLRQYERLSQTICSLKRRSLLQIRNKRSKIQDEALNEIVRQNIIHCIKHHQMLYKNFHLFKTWFSVFFSLELAICVLSFAFGLCVLINAPGIGETINYFGVAVIININIFGRCFIGEMISNLNDRMKDVLFWESEWYEMSASNCQLIVTFHLMLCRPFQLYGFSIFGATRVTFGKIIRLTYSAFNILNMSIEK